MLEDVGREVQTNGYILAIAPCQFFMPVLHASVFKASSLQLELFSSNSSARTLQLELINQRESLWRHCDELLDERSVGLPSRSERPPDRSAAYIFNICVRIICLHS